MDQGGSPSTSSDDTARDNAAAPAVSGKVDAVIDYGSVLQMLKPQPPKASPKAAPSHEETAAAVADAMADAASKLPLDLTLNPNFPTLFGASLVSEAPGLSPPSRAGSPEVAPSRSLLEACEGTSSAISGDAQRQLSERQRQSEARIASLEALLHSSGGGEQVQREELRAVQAELKRLSVRGNRIYIAIGCMLMVHSHHRVHA